MELRGGGTLGAVAISPLPRPLTAAEELYYPSALVLVGGSGSEVAPNRDPRAAARPGGPLGY